MNLLARLFGRAVKRRVQPRVRPERWCIGYRRRTGTEDSPAGQERVFRRIPAPADRFFADPFILEHQGHRCVFFEDRRLGEPWARISYVELDGAGRPSAPRPALEGAGHFSYPFVFRDGDSVYMIPETSARRVVELYRAVRFPGEWTLENVLLRGIAATDATLVAHGDRLWLFVAVALDGDKRFDELFLFSSETLLGEWMPHPMNPVVSDVRSARPAGRTFLHDGRLIRPSQDCSGAYGRRIVLNQIESLDETGYREMPLGCIETRPGTPFSRTHSYNVWGEYEVVDAIERIRRLRWRAGARRPMDIPLRFSLPSGRRVGQMVR